MAIEQPATPNSKMRRLGPRPLPLHLSLSILTWMSSRAALPIWKQGSPPWSPLLEKRHVELAAEAAAQPLDCLTSAIDREISKRAGAFAAAVERYREHPYRRDLPPGEVIWQEGSTRIIDYGPFVKGRRPIPLLVIPSLINRAYILDLSSDASLLRWLAARGIRPFLVDWGRPGAEERDFGLTDYVVGRLGRALDAVAGEVSGPLQLLGYCMGGLLALGLALRQEEKVSALSLLATPWDFHAGGSGEASLLAAAFPALLPVMTFAGELPADAIQALFTALDPLLVQRKYLAFGRLDPESEQARRFVALEDWVNDGVPLANSVARECLLSWYGENLTSRGAWRLAGQEVRPLALACPTFCVIPARDRIVPPASARALADAIPESRVLTPPTGHIGMLASARAPNRVWAPLLDWLKTQS